MPAGVVMSETSAPMPYTVGQLSAFNQEGRTYVFRIESLAAPAMRRTMRFDAVDAEGAWVVSTIAPWTPEDAPVNTTRAYQSWEELQSHAAYPVSETARTWSSVELPTGSVQCVLYTVQESDSRVTKSCFNLDTAGPPIYSAQFNGSTPVFSMTLQSTGM
ncbi:MAG: hypothetical protein ACJATT_004325 [Myxococcota bacterium]|jgi:hypothetical protein